MEAFTKTATQLSSGIKFLPVGKLGSKSKITRLKTIHTTHDVGTSNQEKCFQATDKLPK